MRKSLVAIENWAVVESVISPSYEDLQPGKHLMGNVLGHASLQNTKLIYTSRILNVFPGVVETLNTLYQLGEPSEEYQEWERKREAGLLPEAALRARHQRLRTTTRRQPKVASRLGSHLLSKFGHQTGYIRFDPAFFLAFLDTYSRRTHLCRGQPRSSGRPMR